MSENWLRGNEGIKNDLRCQTIHRWLMAKSLHWKILKFISSPCCCSCSVCHFLQTNKKKKKHFISSLLFLILELFFLAIIQFIQAVFQSTVIILVCLHCVLYKSVYTSYLTPFHIIVLPFFIALYFEFGQY